MIVFRYLARQVLQATAVTALVLLAVAIIARFSKYLGEAAGGQKAADALLLIVLYRLPEFLLVIVPLAWLLGVILTYGRMHAENEMVSLMGAGIGRSRLTKMTLGIATVVMACMALLGMAVAPWGMRHAESLVRDQEQLTELDLIVAGQFRQSSDGSRVTWTESVGESASGGRELRKVFVAVAGDGATAPLIVLAETARAVIDRDSGARFMQLADVAQYDGAPGSANFRIGTFDSQSIVLPAPARFDQALEQAALPTRELIGSADPAHRSELQWRLSLLLLPATLAMLAVPLSEVRPRQGRHTRLVPAALVYVIYFALLEFCRDAVANGASPLAFWLVHALFLAPGALAMRQGRETGLLRP